jgi:hypothetical protein
LAIGQVREFNARRIFFRAGFDGIEPIVNVFRDNFRLFRVEPFRVLVRHVAVDVFGETLEIFRALERFVVFAFDAFAIFAVAFGAMLFVNGAAIGGVTAKGAAKRSHQQNREFKHGHVEWLH